MSRAAAGTVQFRLDMTDINELIGTVYATEDISSGSKYMRSLIKSAFEDTKEEFDREAATTAVATGKFRHMFEWGSTGINRGSPKINPDTARARLWETVMIQGNTVSEIEFIYKPSVAKVPRPSASETGIPSNIISKLRDDHIFWNKAKVMETGMTVEVARVQAKRLFIPKRYRGQKGFFMTLGPTNPTPGVSRFRGETAKGTFTAYFTQFWEGRGAVNMKTHAETFFNMDFEEVIRKIETNKGRYGEPNIRDMKITIARTRRTVLRQLEQAAEKREMSQ